MIYVARQLGHDARLTLTRYGHVIDELESHPRVAAEELITDARGRGAAWAESGSHLRLRWETT